MATRLAGSWIGYQARVCPNHVELADLATGRRLRYGELDDRIGRLAGALARRYGVALGDRVAMLSRNCAQAFELMYACGRIGAIFVPLNARLSDSELAALTADAAPGLLAGEADLLMVLARPAGLDAGEITDKGYGNPRRVLTRRAILVGLLYAEPPVRGVIVAEGTP